MVGTWICVGGDAGGWKWMDGKEGKSGSVEGR